MPIIGRRLRNQNNKYFRPYMAKNDVMDEPEEWVCPITLTRIVEPVVLQDGHSYEREAAERWISRCQDHHVPVTSPATGALLDSANIYPNHALKSIIASDNKKRSDEAAVREADRVVIILKARCASMETYIHSLNQEKQKSVEHHYSMRGKPLRTIRIKALAEGAREIKLSVYGEDTIKDLKEMHEVIIGAPVPMVRLIFGGKALDDTKTVNDYGIVDGDLLCSVMAMRGD